MFNVQPLHRIEPFAEWKTSHKLSWYQAYNTVKHNRVSEFKEANLFNVLAAMAAVFIVITKGGLCPMDKSKWLHPNGMVSIIDDRNLIMRQSLKRNLPDSAD